MRTSTVLTSRVALSETSQIRNPDVKLDDDHYTAEPRNQRSLSTRGGWDGEIRLWLLLGSETHGKIAA